MPHSKRSRKITDDVPDYETDFSLDNSEIMDEGEEIVEVGMERRRYENNELRRQGYGDNGLDYDLYQAAE